jgi:hypothetical protein
MKMLHYVSALCPYAVMLDAMLPVKWLSEHAAYCRWNEETAAAQEEVVRAKKALEDIRQNVHCITHSE